MSYTQNNPFSRKSSPLNKDDQWIQKATADIKKRGTEGVCTGDKFGGPTCPPGSKRYNLAKTFKSMAKDRKGGPSRESSEEKYMPIEDDMHKKGEGDMGMSRQPWGGNKHDYKRRDVEGVMKKTGDVDGHYKDYEGPSRKSSSSETTRKTVKRLKPDYSDYEKQQKRHHEKPSQSVDERSGNRFPGVREGQRDATTFIKSHPQYISKEKWANATDEQKDISSSPLNNTGMTGLNYSKELQYMPIEDDMHRGMSRESSEGKQIRSAVKDLRKATKLNRKDDRNNIWVGEGSHYREIKDLHQGAKETYSGLSDKGKAKAHKKMGRTLGYGKQWIEKHGEGPSRESSSPLDYGSWAHEDAMRAKDLYKKGDYAHARALGIDEHDADYAKHWYKGEAEHGPSRHAPGHLSAYEGVDSKSLHPYDDGAGGIDYERMAKDSTNTEKKMMMTKNIKPLPKKMMMTKKLTKIAKPKSGGPR